MSVRKAALTHGIPVQTLRDRTTGKFKDIGNKTLITREEELVLVEHVTVMAQLGYGYTNIQLQHFAGEMMKEFGRRESSKPLSNNWLYGFLGRWSDKLKSLNPSKLESTRAKNSTPEKIANYYEELDSILEKYDLKSSPDRIFNLDETGLQPDHRPPNIVASTETKPQMITSPRSTTVTLIGCVSAIGKSLPPYFIFKGKRYNPNLMKGACVGATAAMSDSGWSNRQIFQSYLEDHFLKYVQPSESKPVLLMYGGHASHVSPSLIQWAKEHHIILFVLPPHTSHLLQPLDVGIFGPFKKFYHTECSIYMRNNIGQIITKYNIAAIASKAYLKATTPINIQSAFKKTGIFPFSSDVISCEELYAAESFREEDPVQKVQQMREGKIEASKFIKEKMEKCYNPNEDLKKQTRKEETGNNKPIEPKKPQPGGKAITEGDFHSQLINYETEKTKKNATCNKRKNAESKCITNGSSQQPTGSGCAPSKPKVGKRQPNDEDSEDDIEISEADKCCVCKLYSPPDLSKCTYLKIVSWGQCDKCFHWVHLSFCTNVKVLRRNSEFFCPCCQ